MNQPIIRIALVLGCLAGLNVSMAQHANYRLAGDGPLRINRVVYGRLPDYAGPSGPLQVTQCNGPGSPNHGLGCDCTDKGLGVESGSRLAPDFDTLSSADDVSDPMGAYSASPGIIGDFFGGGLRFEVSGQSFTNPLAAGDRIFKIVENMNPIPTDRVFFNYHMFNKPLVTGDGRGIDLNRFNFGIERTILDGLVSFEIRIPFASGLNATQNISPAQPEDNERTEFGNMNFAVKALLWNDRWFKVSAGLGMSAPTGRDSTILSGTSFIGTFNNESYFLQPFMACLIIPNEHSWLQLVSQASLTANGNSAFLGASGATGVVQDQSLLFLTASHGTWIYRNDQRSAFLRGIAPIFELHYTTTMQDTDVFFDPISGKRIRNPGNRLDILNVTGGLRLQLGAQTFVTASAVAPLRDGWDKLFDSEFSLQVVRTH